MRLNSNIKNSTPFYYFFDAVDHIAKKGWLEGNSGSITALLDKEDIYPYFEDYFNPTEYKLDIAVPNLSEQYILVTGKNIPLRNINKFKFKCHRMMGVIKMNFKGDGYKILWGFQDGATPTNYLNMHLLSHNNIIERDKKHRILVHCHPTYLTMKTMTDHTEDEFKFSYELWDAMPHISNWIPQGIRMVENTATVEDRTIISEKFKETDVVVWRKHGIMVATKSFDDSISYIEIMDKAGNMAMKVQKEPWSNKPEFFEMQEEVVGIKYNEEVLNAGRKPKHD
ncbi:class II aldolase/adducin family protein [[Acholeplasma] multilocale]|uniref:class II aldolase/adducin family protein n=1 Tax=[Acholeplasma] multilocale TaxID=264638 RepID=UPI0004794780|nr:class II aldolase/adducin family protein [[Acholeplasma] multilocale]